MQFTTEFCEKDFRKKLCRHLKEANDVVQPFEKIQLNSYVLCSMYGLRDLLIHFNYGKEKKKLGLATCG